MTDTRNDSDARPARPAELSERQVECLQRIAAGATSAEIAQSLGLSVRTVVDRLIDVAELRLGEKPQSIVRITRTGDRS